MTKANVDLQAWADKAGELALHGDHVGAGMLMQAVGVVTRLARRVEALEPKPAEEPKEGTA